MKNYQCHKRVKAFKIGSVSWVYGDTVKITGTDSDVRVVKENWCRTGTAEWVGGYFVEYEDGYTSWSPAKAFEEGYTLID